MIKNVANDFVNYLLVANEERLLISKLYRLCYQVTIELRKLIFLKIHFKENALIKRYLVARYAIFHIILFEFIVAIPASVHELFLMR